jgi:Ca-activated chloride channel family protein
MSRNKEVFQVIFHEKIRVVHRNAKILLIAAVICMSGTMVQASGVIIPRPPRDVAPQKIYHPLSIKSHHVEVSINNQAAKTKIKQVFSNKSNRVLEGTYIFPIPQGASITEFAMWMNGEKVEGELVDARQARRIYNDIVRRMKDPGLLEYAGSGLFRANVYPIPKKGDVKIEIVYEELLSMDAGLISYQYPLRIEKFSHQRLRGVSIAVKIRSNTPIKSIYSPSHDIDSKNTGNSAWCSFEDEKMRSDKDFILYYAVSQDELGLNLLTHRMRGEDGYFMLLLSPGEMRDNDKIIQKDVVFVIDRSGSMKGKKIEQAKAAFEYCLRRLNKGDRFNVLSFSTGVDRLARGLIPIDRESRSRALEFIDDIEARGGTNINDALRAALKFPKSRRPQMIVFLTDGLPTVGETNPGSILSNVVEDNSGNVRIFPFGVGFDVNTHLLDRLSEENRGTVAYITPEEDIEEKVTSFFSKVSDPVLSNITLDFGQVRTYGVYPYNLPDIFSGEQLVVFGRYEGRGAGMITLSGYVGEEERTFEYTGRFNKRKRSNSFIPRLWANRKIAYLLSELKLHGHDEELKDEIVALATEFGIVTPYTSYLVLEDEDSEMLSSAFRGGSTGGVYNGAAPRVFGGVKNKRPRSASGMAPAEGFSGSQSTIMSKDVAERKEQSVVEAPGVDKVKYVENKTFYRVDDAWVDADFEESMKVTEIKFMSDEYFELLARLPDTGKFMSLGKKVTFVHAGKAYRIIE